MAYDEGLAQRIRESLGDQPDLSEIQMFGGIGFMARGNMVCGVLNDSLIVRVGPERYPEALGPTPYPGIRLYGSTHGRLGHGRPGRL